MTEFHIWVKELNRSSLSGTRNPKSVMATSYLYPGNLREALDFQKVWNKDSGRTYLDLKG